MAMDPKTLARSYEKAFGDSALRNKHRRLEPLPTGLPELDNYFLGIGGFPRGCVVEISGPESSAKSALMYHLIGETLRRGGAAVLADAEGAFDPEWAGKIGIDVDDPRFFLIDFTTTEDCFEKIRFFVSEGVDLVVVDSVARLEPESYFEGKSVGLGERARVNRRELGRLIAGTKKTKRLRDTRCCVCFINHIYEKIGVTFGDPYDTPGGRALKFDAHLRLRTSAPRWSPEKDSRGIPVRQYIRLKTLKSRLGWSPKSEVDLWLDSHGKFSVSPDVVVGIGLGLGLLKQRGSWYEFEWDGETRKMQKSDFVRYVRETPDLADHLFSSPITIEEPEEGEGSPPPSSIIGRLG